jgi:hypothetical protein
VSVCLCVSTLEYPEGGGFLWVYLNWALGLRALGQRVIWLEDVASRASGGKLSASVAALRDRLEPYGLGDSIALWPRGGEPPPPELAGTVLDIDAAAEADLLLNFRYGVAAALVKRFRRSALVDIDPGLLQCWIQGGHIEVAPHAVYFTTGETVGRPGSRFPDAGIEWHHAPPCVALRWWPPCRADDRAPFTTVSHWTGDEWMADAAGLYRNDKRSGFLPYLDLPRRARVPLELALCLGDDEAHERAALEARGWRVRDAGAVAGTPWDYRDYVQRSRGEWSAAKPSCVRLQNAWISDRTLCYLASGKPAVVQHTGPSRLLPDAAGLLRFRDLDEAARCLETVAADYDRQSRLARALAEEHFDARQVTGRVLERALA